MLVVIVVATRVETLMEYRVETRPVFLTTKFPWPSKSPPTIAVISDDATPEIAPRSVTAPALSILTKFPAVLPFAVVVAMPYI